MTYINITLPHGTKIFRDNEGTDEEPVYVWNVWPRVGRPIQWETYLTALESALWYERRCRADDYAARVIQRIQMEVSNEW